MVGRQYELAHEQEVVDGLYARLDELRDRTRRRLRTVRLEGPSGSMQNRSERDALATLYEDRSAQLEAVEDRLAFGRLDFFDGAPRYVGRIGLTDDDQRTLLTDWRAPAAEAFYRATVLSPQGVVRRRHLVMAARAVAGIEDELLDLDHGEGLDASTLSGEGALMAALAARRTGHMSDIVATIQSEQDRIIRSGPAGALVVQGGPGTGKTAVALHRAAYLLYAHREVLERSGVLLVGPSRSFLHYIDQVLPSLGETGVVSTTLGGLLPGIAAVAIDEGRSAEIKGRLLWADVVRRAVRARERVPERDVRIRLHGNTLVIARDDVAEAIATVRRKHLPHNEARVVFVGEMLSVLVRQYEAADGDVLGREDRASVLADLRALREVRLALNLAWFPISPRKLIDDLLSRPHRLREAAPELTDAERAAVLRAPHAPWTESDIPLLDEAAELLGDDGAVTRAAEKAQAAERAEAVEHAREVIESGQLAGSMIPVDAETLADRFVTSGPRLTTAERAAADRTWTYGHVVVDEAQELSPMAWRMLVRRVPTRSITIVGDVAQRSSPAGAQSWSAALDPVLRSSWRLEELTVSYRTPAEIVDTAQRFAQASGLPASPLTAARDLPGAIVDAQASPGEVIATVSQWVATLFNEFLGPDGSGRLAVIAPAASVVTLRAALTTALPTLLGSAEAARLLHQPTEEAQVTVLTPHEVKGLEYDAVVLVEPADIARGRGGPSDLYVAMTRPTQRLVVVHERPLPAGFAPKG